MCIYIYIYIHMYYGLKQYCNIQYRNHTIYNLYYHIMMYTTISSEQQTL